MSINMVTISGNATRDAELRQTQSGMAVLQFGMAVNDRRKNNQTGEWDDYPNYIDCTMFGNRAQALAKYISKGTKLAVQGKLRYSSWQTQDGSKRSKLEVVVDELEFMSRQEASQGGSQGGYGQQAGGYAYGGGNAPQNAPQQSQGGYGYGQPAPQQQGGYQEQQQPMPQPVMELEPNIYDTDIPFGG